jgi:hypothetical protein
MVELRVDGYQPAPDEEIRTCPATFIVPACDKDKREIEYTYVVPTPFNASSF